MWTLTPNNDPAAQIDHHYWQSDLFTLNAEKLPPGRVRNKSEWRREGGREFKSFDNHNNFLVS
jgi:hypothetical protein